MKAKNNVYVFKTLLPLGALLIFACSYSQQNGGHDLPRINGPWFQNGQLNPYAYSYKGQCTWYVFGRCGEAGWTLNMGGLYGDGHTFYTRISNGSRKDYTPEVGAVMGYPSSHPDSNGHGHVAYVVAVTDNNHWSIAQYNYHYPEKWEIASVTRNPANSHQAKQNSGAYYDFQGFVHPPQGSGSAVGRGAPNPQLFIDCFSRNGGVAVVGQPLGDVVTWGSNTSAQDFDGGSGGRGTILVNPNKNTAYWVHGAIWQKYNPNFPSVGWPIGDQLVWGSNTPAQDFDGGTDGRGTILVNGSNAYWVHGPIWVAYNPIFPDVGLPISDQIIWGAGVPAQDFDGGNGGRGTMLVNGGTAYWIHGSTWNKYGPLFPVLGKPTSNEQNVVSSRGTRGYLQQFENGSIARSDLYGGPFSIISPVWQLWVLSGGLTGNYGFPVDDQQNIGAFTRQRFEGGTVTVGGSGSIKISAKASLNGGNVSVQITVSNIGDGLSHDVRLSPIQLGPIRLDNEPWIVGDLAPNASAIHNVTLTTGFGNKKISILSAMVDSEGISRRQLVRVFKP